MTTESETSSSRGGSSDDMEIERIIRERNGTEPKRRKSESTKIIQVANIAPQTSKEQLQTLFSYVGKIDDIRVYPAVDIGMQLNSKICFIKFFDSNRVSAAQHLTNTVFIDRALVVIPYMESQIPDEQKGLELLTSGTLLPGVADPKLPQHVTSQLEGYPPHQVVGTYDPRLAESRLPMYPPLPNNYDSRKIEEIRRTLMVASLDPEVSSQTVLNFFNKYGEVKYFRLCTRDNDPIRYALVEFSDQPAILEALKLNGFKLGTKCIKVFHATQAIVKPQAKTNEAAQKEIEDAMSRQAQSILSQGIDGNNPMTAVAHPHLVGPIILKDKRRSRSRHRSRSRRRSRSRSKRRRSRSSSRRRDYRQRSRSRTRVSRRRSRSKEHYKRRTRSRSPSRSRRSRSGSNKKDKDKKSSSSSSRKHKDKKKEREKDDRKDREDRKGGDEEKRGSGTVDRERNEQPIKMDISENGGGSGGTD